MASGCRELLRRLADGERSAEREVMGLGPQRSPSGADRPDGNLPPSTRALVRLAALLADGAPAPCLYWAAQLVRGAGADDMQLITVLEIVAAEAGTACVVAGASPLAVGLGFDPGGIDGVAPIR